MFRKILSSFTISGMVLAPLGCGDGSVGDGGTGGLAVTGGASTGGAASAGGSGGLGSGSSPSAGGTSSGGQIGSGGLDGSTGGAVGDTFVEDDGTDCALGTLPDEGDLASSDKLPDPFTKLDGARMTTRAEWRCRRQEIKRLAEKFVLGAKPPPPESVSGTVSGTSITVNVTDGGKSTSFTVDVELPTGAGPYPALIAYESGFFGFSYTGLAKQEGVAIVHYDPYAIGSESGSRGSKSGAFYQLYGSNSTAGLLVAWAWGVSRILDVIEQSDGSVLAVRKMAVGGCSRFGKGAFAAGVLDQRVALTIPFESGSAGVPIWRGIPGEGAQSPGSAYGETYWLGDAFEDFTGSGGVNRLPVDTHELVALVAPRGLLVLDNPHIANLGPRSAHVAVLGGAEVYEALGVGDNVSYHSAVASGTHCEARGEHQEPLRAHIAKHLKGTGSAPGVITAASKATGTLDGWRTWTTPTLD